MWNISRLVLITGLLLSALASAVWAQELHLRGRFIEELPGSGGSGRATPRPGASAGKNIANADFTIGLGKSYFFLEKNKIRHIYDFRSMTRKSLNIRDRTYKEQSLYGEPIARIDEFQKRVTMAVAVNAAAGKDGGERLFDLETLICMELAGFKSDKLVAQARKLPNDELVADKIPGHVVFRCGGATAVTHSVAGAKLDAEQSQLYGAFLLYECRIHPRIRRGIIEGRTAPNRLSFSYKYGSQTLNAAYVITSVEKEDTDTSGIPWGYRHWLPKDDRLGNELQRLLDKSRSSEPQKEEEVEKFVTERISNAQYLEALLGLLESEFQSGEFNRALLRELMQAAGDDEVIQALRVSLDGGGNEEGAIARVRVLDGLKKKTTQKGYVLDAISIQHLILLGKRDQAVKQLLSALAKNPHMTAAYTDLGRMYFSIQRHDLAWRCWQRAREIAPDHPDLKSIAAMEEIMQKDFPQFFLIGHDDSGSQPATATAPTSQASATNELE